MDVRRAISDNPKTVTVVSVAVILVAIGAIVYSMKSGSGFSAPNSCWYSVDDGATWFKDRQNKMPFEYNGRPAYRVHIFDDGAGKPFAVYLERFAPSAEKQLKALRGTAEVPPEDQKMAFGRIASFARQVKRVGAPETEWASLQTEAGMHATTVPRRSGASKEIEEVSP